MNGTITIWLTVNMVFRAENDVEYKSIAYIFALPDIYKHCIMDEKISEYPFLWTKVYQDTSYVEQDEEGEYFISDFEISKDDSGVEIQSENFTTLSSGYKKLVYLANNLFNSDKELNLMNGIGVWDDKLVKVYLQAVMIRIEKREIKGLNISIQ